MTATVLIPSYRRPDRLAKCLDGVMAGRRLPEQIVVVLRDIDQESQSCLDDWLAQNRPQDRGVTLTRAIADRPGQIVAMNFGLQAATGDVVCFIDDDCVPWQDWLERIMAYYDEPTVGGVGGRDVVHEKHEQGDVLFGRVDCVGQIAWSGRIVGNHHLDFLHGSVEVDHLKGANMSFRRALLKPFDENMSGGSCCLNDTDASLHVRSQGYRLIYDPVIAVDHYPAQRFGDSTREKTAPGLVYSDSHNWVYCMLKYMGPVRRCVFMAYALLVGTGTRYGVAKWLAALPRSPRDATVQFWASTRGKIAGVRTYLKHRRGLPPSAEHGA